MSFDNLGLDSRLLSAIEAKGYTNPTPIQKQSIPVILSGKDILAGAQTGTGKTAAFTLPLLHILQEGKSQRNPRALVLTPTRELAAQVEESIDTYGSNMPLKSTVIYGGVSIRPQISRLKAGVDILVATPGRLLDHVQQKTLKLSNIEVLVLDEADRMLDMGFIHDIKKILKLLPEKRQNMLFSATYSDEIKQLSESFLDKPELIEVARRNTAAELVTQHVYPVEKTLKRHLLVHMIKTENWSQALIFTRTKHGANRLAKQIQAKGINASAIHGNKSQGARTKALESFKAGNIKILVATDIAARGLDINNLPHVVNYDLPNVPEDYVHRIGRTGRAGSEGVAISLVCNDEKKQLNAIQRLLKTQIKQAFAEEFDYTTPPALPNNSPLPSTQKQKANNKRHKFGFKHKHNRRNNNNNRNTSKQNEKRRPEKKAV